MTHRTAKIKRLAEQTKMAKGTKRALGAQLAEYQAKESPHVLTEIGGGQHGLKVACHR